MLESPATTAPTGSLKPSAEADGVRMEDATSRYHWNGFASEVRGFLKRNATARDEKQGGSLNQPTEQRTSGTRPGKYVMFTVLLCFSLVLGGLAGWFAARQSHRASWLCVAIRLNRLGLSFGVPIRVRSGATLSILANSQFGMRPRRLRDSQSAYDSETVKRPRFAELSAVRRPLG